MIIARSVHSDAGPWPTQLKRLRPPGGFARENVRLLDQLLRARLSARALGRVNVSDHGWAPPGAGRQQASPAGGRTVERIEASCLLPGGGERRRPFQPQTAGGGGAFDVSKTSGTGERGVSCILLRCLPGR
jgi:hypothetical protein